MNRRNLLQYFGIGTLITPVVGGAPLIEAAAKLLSVPNLAETPEFPNGHVPGNERYSHRLKWNPYEALWLAMWQIENNPSPGINYGVGPLEHILGREPNEQEKAAVAGMIQWFGTNCGNSFIQEVLRASGYRITWDHGNLQAREIQALQYGNIWDKDYPKTIKIRHTGREIELKQGTRFTVSSR